VSGGIDCTAEMQAQGSRKELLVALPFTSVWLLLEWLLLLLGSALTDLGLEDVFPVVAGRYHRNIEGEAGNRISCNREGLGYMQFAAWQLHFYSLPC